MSPHWRGRMDTAGKLMSVLEKYYAPAVPAHVDPGDMTGEISVLEGLLNIVWTGALKRAQEKTNRASKSVRSKRLSSVDSDVDDTVVGGGVVGSESVRIPVDIPRSEFLEKLNPSGEIDPSKFTWDDAQTIIGICGALNAAKKRYSQQKRDSVLNAAQVMLLFTKINERLGKYLTKEQVIAFMGELKDSISEITRTKGTLVGDVVEGEVREEE